MFSNQSQAPSTALSPTMSTTLITNCTLFPGSGHALIDNAYLLVEGNAIAAIGPMPAPPVHERTRAIDAAGKLVMPGLINAHNHCAMTLFRGMADDLELTAWLHQYIFPAEARHISPEMVYWCTKLAACEMMLSGTTCVADAYFFSGASGSGPQRLRHAGGDRPRHRRFFRCRACRIPPRTWRPSPPSSRPGRVGIR